MNKRIIIPRVSNDETTFAVVEYAGVQRDELLERITVAVTEWVRGTEAGESAWEESCRDFNVGDLANCLGNPSLRKALLGQGITYLDIDCYSDSDYPAGWTYDTILADHR